MTLLTAMMMTVTLTMAAVMVPRIYYSWLRAEQCCLDEEPEPLRELLAEENDWVMRHLGFGVLALALIWMVKHSRQDLEIPVAMAAAMALYTTISFLFAVIESLLAQKISAFLAGTSLSAKMRQQR